MEIAIGGVCCSLTPTMTLGGSDGKGNDLANAVTRLCLKAAEETKMVQPQFTVRWHENIPSALLDQVFDVIVAGGAPPAFINERAIIAGFVSHGVAEDDAREFAIIGCNEIGIPGKMIGGGLPRGVALVKALELALDGGVSRYSGKTIGVKTKKLGEFASFDELLAAYKAQVEYFTRFVVAGANEMDIIHRDLGPLPFADSMWHGAMEKGRDLYVESDYFFFGLGCTDFVNAVDSLYVLKKVVFESNTVSQEELAKAIKNNFEGLQQVRKQLLGADKFGNDLETVDALIPLVEKISYDAIKPYRSARKQTHFIMECIPRTAHAAEGAVTQATVDGRIAGCSLAPGMCAEPGKDIQGPTALLNSISKLNIQQWCGGVISNMRLQSSMLTEPDRREKVKRLLAGYFSRNGQHLQINCVTQEILLEAQKHPGDYQDLIVRVGGYCDYFTCMSRPLQDEIIQRTAQG
jgi:formate C-acetyltransferase